MLDNTQFAEKWSSARIIKGPEEFSIFVPFGKKPETQRQFNLYNYFEFIRELASEKNCHKSLELGCGRGTMSLYLNKYLNIDVTLSDISEEGLALARDNFAFHHSHGIFVLADARKLPMQENQFDMTLSIGLSEHFENYDEIYAEQCRVLKPGGVIVSLNIPGKKSIQALNDIYRFFIKFSGKKINQDYFRNDDTPADYKKSAERAGFVEVKTFFVNSFPLFTPINNKCEKLITTVYSAIYKIRGVFMGYPFVGSRLLSQAHFLVGIKPKF